MDFMGMFLVGMGIFLIVVVGVFIYAALMRMTGRRSRFDQFAETMVRAQGAAIYPPSLRGDPNPPVIEEIEVDRATNASRHTPTAGTKIRRANEPGTYFAHLGN